MQVFVSVVEMETPKKTRITMGITVSFNNSTCKKVINYLKTISIYYKNPAYEK